ncbi:NAD-dependent succinate-semialdehyde dehydrogenase [Methylacidiphilum caldifontis]|uniref:Succinate-semialdehyde dehydrogenase (NADP(+)) n=1 Tax=Methylacidiphilum caldifontis TaxID=2795386 RepID=A0A4Y8PGW3_9BACT|nr:NAD-dependent succinate-semialdehyde dehydrogenase [Methylacidiphilum caldifontis]QSR88459.1 NAD-dependent succinate-semialdehyde dehydrogenase [Methylacidiphilum caldifontis]TFE71288.1 succinate-semialdehyde dehydrogenase (NADP(+)) [Methylacidiphilum caldifontis]
MYRETLHQKWITQGKIGSDWVETLDSFELISPIDGRVIGLVSDCGPEEARWAIDESQKAFELWKNTTAEYRSELLRSWAQLIVKEKTTLAEIMALEMGKPVKEGRKEIDYAASFVNWYAEEAKRIYGMTIPPSGSSKKIIVSHEPVGPVLCITPWNFPSAMVTRKAASAMAAGCTVIVKPSEHSPLSALYLVSLWDKVGGPPGVFQVLPTSRPEKLCKPFFDDFRIRKVSFTGSVPVGKALYQESAKTLKGVLLELGGNAPMIVFADANLDIAVREAIQAKFRNAGQACIAVNRLYVENKIIGSFCNKLVEETKKLRVGNPLDEGVDIGPLVNEKALKKIDSLLSDALSKGAEIIYRGEATGLYFGPTIVRLNDTLLQIVTHEIFGPVLPVIPFESESEVVSWANGTRYGLAAYIMTSDLRRAFRLSHALEFGIVGINDGRPSCCQAPFGGIKESGIGREGGQWGIKEFLETKYLSFNLE